MAQSFSDAPISVFTDELTRRLYANDASMYEELPKGVCFPSTTNDISKLISWAAQHRIPITPRAAGTSLAGQTTGGGIVMDISRNMTDILEFDQENQKATVQPGVIRDTLNGEAAKYGLIFGPDTSTTNRCMIGGMIGNNSAGSFSIKYGTTRDKIHSVEMVLDDGSVATFEPLTNEELEAKTQLQNREGEIYREVNALLKKHRELIVESYPHPDIIRRNTGYALDVLLKMEPFTPGGRPFNLAELVCGSEGTLGIITQATVNLDVLDKHSLLIIPHYHSLKESLTSTVEIVKSGPAAVELADRIILDATKGNREQSRNRFFLEGDPDAILTVQLDGNSMEDLEKRAKNIITDLKERGLGYAYPIVRDPEKQKRVWDLRKAGLGLLMGLGKDEKTPSFVEDTAVRVEDLPHYIEDFDEILEKYNCSCVYYAHASVGELHLRPALDIKTQDGIEKMKKMAHEIALLVKKYKGSLSGEHGDGRVRAPYIPYVLSEEMMPVLEELKDIFDPADIFNPAKIVRTKSIDSDLRYGSDYTNISVPTVYKYRKEGSFGDAVELCNGAGVCRKLADSGGTMCPSYMATKNEKDSTRGRANLFRQLFSGKQKDAFTSEELHDALDLCLSCKACKTECPANVDMAKLKAEFTQGWHRENGTSLSYRFFGQPKMVFKLAQIFPLLSNIVAAQPATKEIFEQLFNVSKKRSLPEFSHQSFYSWFKKHRQNGAVRSDKKVVLLLDLYTHHNEPEMGKSLVRVCEALGYEVISTSPTESGRTQMSKGLLKQAKLIAEENITKLYDFAKNGIPIVGLEPSEILSLRDEYLDLCDDEFLEKAKTIADQSFMAEEFLLNVFKSTEDLSEIFRITSDSVKVHGHCHAKSLVGMQPTLDVLSAIGLLPEDLKTGCCGMAGSFGYETDHYETSMQVGELTLFPKLRETEDTIQICAPGFSCRHQIKDGVQKKALHPVQILERYLV
jgi:FAD/FMN-containing dehydrogenase/Fe-S oxidoreductase